MLIVTSMGGGAELVTAFRPLGLTLKQYRSVPMDAKNRSLREVIARQKAARTVNDIASRGGR